MKISALEEYGLRCLVLLAKNGGGPLTLPEISTREGLSLAYATKLLMILKKAGLVKAVRGRRGGYVLSQSANLLKLKRILDSLGEPLYSPKKHCGHYTGELARCIHQHDCTVRNMWRGFNEMIGQVLEKMTLADLVSGNYAFMQIRENVNRIINTNSKR